MSALLSPLLWPNQLVALHKVIGDDLLVLALGPGVVDEGPHHQLVVYNDVADARALDPLSGALS